MSSSSTLPAMLAFRLAGIASAPAASLIYGTLAVGRYVQPHLLNYIDGAGQSQSQAQNAVRLFRDQVVTDVVNWYVQN